MDYIDSAAMQNIYDQSLFKAVSLEEDFWRAEDAGAPLYMKMFDVVADPLMLDTETVTRKREENKGCNSESDDDECKTINIDTNLLEESPILPIVCDFPLYGSVAGIDEKTAAKGRKNGIRRIQPIFQMPNVPVKPRARKQRTSYQRTPLSKEARKDMLKWILDHESHPYPSKQVKEEFCSKHNIEYDQVERFFINTRMRLL